MPVATTASDPRLAVIALGSNLDWSGLTPTELIRAGLLALRSLPGIQSVAASSVWETPAIAAEGGVFRNAVAACWFQHPPDPYVLLADLMAIEQQHGRERPKQATALSAARSLDLDLIALGSIQILSPSLTLPHPRAHERAFVLQPMAELLPDFPLPGRQGSRTVRVLLAQADATGLVCHGPVPGFEPQPDRTQTSPGVIVCSPTFQPLSAPSNDLP